MVNSICGTFYLDLSETIRIPETFGTITRIIPRQTVQVTQVTLHMTSPNKYCKVLRCNQLLRIQSHLGTHYFETQQIWCTFWCEKFFHYLLSFVWYFKHKVQLVSVDCLMTQYLTCLNGLYGASCFGYSLGL